MKGMIVLFSHTDTAYPYLKSKFDKHELIKFYTPTREEVTFCNSQTRGEITRLGFLLLLKIFQRLGYFINSHDIPNPIFNHIAKTLEIKKTKQALLAYDKSEIRRKHLSLIRDFLKVKPFSLGGRHVLIKAFSVAAATKDDLADIINVGIETLILNRFELPGFILCYKEAQKQRTLSYKNLFQRIHNKLGVSEKKFLNILFIKNPETYNSLWNEIKQDSVKATLSGLKSLLEKHNQLRQLAQYNHLIRDIPFLKIKQLALEGKSLDVASMIKIKASKRYTVALCLVKTRFAQIVDDSCDVFIKQIRKVQRKGEEELNKYLLKNQEKTDEILSQFAYFDKIVRSGQSPEEQLQSIQKAIISRPDLSEFSRVHSEYGGKSPCRFMSKFFKPRRSVIFKMLSELRFISTTQDNSIIEALNFALYHRKSKKIWISIQDQNLDLSWIPEKWRKLVFEQKNKLVFLQKIHRFSFEICLCSQLVLGLKSGDICVLGSEAYSDFRTQLIPLAECEKTRTEYGKEVGLPVDNEKFATHVQYLLSIAAQNTDKGYPKNKTLRIENGQPTLNRLIKKTEPLGLTQFENALDQRLEMSEISILDILYDTIEWLNWNRFFGPLSGYQGKIKEQKKRYISTVFAYGTGLGSVQASKAFTDFSIRQVSFINQRHITIDNLEKSIVEVINAYNKFSLPKYWGNIDTAAADGTKWNLYENNLISEYHIRYGGYGGLAYYHVSDNYIALFSHFIPCGVYEAIYILDGLIKNKSDIQPNTLHGDTQSQSATVYGLAFLLGIKLMPRIRNWKDLKCFKPNKSNKYNHINEIFTKDSIDWDLIKKHFLDMLQVAQSIKSSRISPSTILRKIGTASKNKLYYAFRELGRVIRTIFLLEYISDEKLRRSIQGATNKAEGFNNFSDWIYFASDTIRENVREEQIKIIKYNHLIANLIIFHNVYSITQAIKDMEKKGYKITSELIAAISPYKTKHINRFGAYEIKERDVAEINYDVNFNLLLPV